MGRSALSPALAGHNSCALSPRLAAAVLQARLDILKIHSRKMNLTRGINLRKIAELMPGASGAEVKVSPALPQPQPGWGPWAALPLLPPDPAGLLERFCPLQGVCTEAGMYALRERRVHVTQEDFEMAVAKVGGAGTDRPRQHQRSPGARRQHRGAKERLRVGWKGTEPLPCAGLEPGFKGGLGGY